MIRFILLTKPNSEYDFKYWLEYHKKYSSQFIILNNSDYNLQKYLNKDDILIKVNGFPDQYNLYNSILTFDFNDGDYIITIDDDEYIYCNGDLESMLNTIEQDIIVLPQILMSTKEILQERDFSIPIYTTHCYRRNDYATTVKTILRYRKNIKYDYTIKDKVGVFGHVPGINGTLKAVTPKFHNGVSIDNVNDSAFAIVDYTSDLRLYHYHIKSIQEWNLKIKRGSAASIIPWYKQEIKENIFVNNYNIFDDSMSKL